MPSSSKPDNNVTWDQKTFDIVAGLTVFVIATILIGEASPKLAYTILGAAFVVMLLNHSDSVSRLVGAYRNSLPGVKG